MSRKRLPEEEAWQRVFFHPEPVTIHSPAVLPVFLPQAGCKRKCIFCDQASQTGVRNTDFERLLHDLRTRLEQRRRLQAPAVELAFYGGTFTALPKGWTGRFMELAAAYLEQDVLCGVRCSTRPDELHPAMLRELRQTGLQMVELGIQTFAPDSLKFCNRGYGPEVAQRACGMVRDAGLELGMQLLPGAPGQSAADFREDLRRTAALQPDLVRLYPCLVLDGTPLAQMWRKGRYEPWSLEQAAQRLAGALTIFWNAGLKVGRLGVHHEPGLEEQVLAGPYHPSLGAMARSAALFRLVAGEVRRFRQLAERPPAWLMIPRRYQGEIRGHKGRWSRAYARLGLVREAVRVWDKGYFSLS